MRRWCALIVMLAACGSSTRATVTPASTTSSSVNTSTTRVHAIPTVVPRTTVRATVPPATSSTVATARADRQLIVVSASGYGGTSAVLRAYERRGNMWQLAYGPWTVIGAMHGFAPPGEKREGDGRVPSGQFGFGFMFGIEPNPGVRFEYRRITSSAVVWDDDPTSARYNEWVDTRVADGGRDPEPMLAPPSYDYGVVIQYNTARTPGLGSGIFLHVSHGSPTHGCISLPSGELLTLLRWLDPAQSPSIAMGVGVGAPSTLNP